MSNNANAASDLTTDASSRPTPWYYTPLIKLLNPAYRYVLWRRYQVANKTGAQWADYQMEIATRFGKSYPAAPKFVAHAKASLLDYPYHGVRIWCHAVSLGETNTIAPMLQALLKKGVAIWLTNTTQTGFARGQQLFKDAIADGQVTHTFVPVDDKKVINTFLTHAKPDLAMFVETELWANTLAILAQRGIASVLVNGRLSEKSFRRYQKFAGLSGSMMHNINRIIAQDDKSAQRFLSLGAATDKVHVADSLKWSTGQSNLADTMSPEDALNKQFVVEEKILQRPIWVAGSTHDKEEAALIEVHQYLCQTSLLSQTLLIIIPRHPERFNTVATLLDKANISYARRSLKQPITDQTQVYLADTMGELPLCYQLSDVAFVGGSLVNIGGHNPIEAASLGKPIIMGKYTQSCEEVVDALRQVGALKVADGKIDTSSSIEAAEDEAIDAAVMDTDTINTEVIDTTIKKQLQAQVSDWLRQPALARLAGQQGKELVLRKRTAMEKQLTLVESMFPNQPPNSLSEKPPNKLPKKTAL